MVDSVATIALEILRDLLIEEAKFLSSVGGEVEEVRRQLNIMHCFLKDANRSQDLYNSQKVQNWVAELRDFSIQADNVLERYAIEVVSRREGKCLKKVLKKFTCILSEWLRMHQIGEDVKDIKSRMSDLTKQSESMSVGDNSTRLVDDNDWSRKTYGHGVEKYFVGTKEDIKYQQFQPKTIFQQLLKQLVLNEKLPTTEIKLLEEYGREIVKRCGYLPLPISVIGGTLCREKASLEWKNVCRNLDSYLQHGKGLENDKNVNQILDLSYNVLPYNLKPCFLSLACFKEDQEIDREKLYLLWMAEAMISSEDKGRGESLRDVAERVSKLPAYEVQLYQNVIELHLVGTRIEKDPMKILEKLPMLRVLGLWRNPYVGREMVCRATGFPQLRDLVLFGLSNLVEWRVEKGAVLNLSFLYIKQCSKLALIPDGLKFISTLKELRIMLIPEEFMKRVQVVDGEE
ncbi:putative disease resistance protein At1g50180 [Sesamum indicum]|uniref:Disease resistance protein At1g50180 n=1 Tax=Sesamum indicum TaxID=4182 RepID=A0A6I9UJT7_SESIN|nr:putative disease resistance protein At1g50180 [Sesamum indicum]